MTLDRHIADHDARLRGYAPLASRFAAGTTTPRAYLEECLERVATLEPTVAAFVVRREEADLADEADASTARWEAGHPLSLIDGMPVGVKDIIETVDLPTGQGSPSWAGTQTGRDAASVHALRQAGAIIIGKTTTNEFAGAYPYHHTRNPHDTQRSPGGSSSGSAAAVSAGMVPVALGTQVFCSILQPASYCGAVGFKPTYGAINRGGSYDQLSQSAHGAIAATLADAWVSLRNIADRVGGDPGHAGLTGQVDFEPAKPTRLAVLETGGWDHTTPGARGALSTATDTLANAGVEIRSRQDDPAVERLEQAIADASSASLALCAWENRWPLTVYAHLATTQLSPDSAQRHERAQAMTAEQYGDLLAHRARARSTLTEAARGYDAFLTLSATGAAPPAAASSTGDPAMSVDASFLGCPTISLPVLHDQGLPLGLQLFSGSGHDAALIRVATWTAMAAFSQPGLTGLSR